MGEIVVGFDGSEGALRALEWAADEASAHTDRVRVVSAFRVPGTGAVDFERAAVPELYHGAQPSEADIQKAQSTAEETFRKALDRVDVPSGVEVTFDAVRGEPAEVLVQESEGARLLVVGSRGLGGFKSLMLGSVSQQVVQHARCPVLVIPGRR